LRGQTAPMVPISPMNSRRRMFHPKGRSGYYSRLNSTAEEVATGRMKYFLVDKVRSGPNPDMTTNLGSKEKPPRGGLSNPNLQSANQLGRRERHLVIADQAKHFYFEPRFGQFDALQALRFFAKDVPFLEHVPTGHVPDLPLSNCLSAQP
jgi:hypothetical protein